MVIRAESEQLRGTAACRLSTPLLTLQTDEFRGSCSSQRVQALLVHGDGEQFALVRFCLLSGAVIEGVLGLLQQVS